MGDITKGAVVRDVDELVAALGKYGAEVGREVEVIVRDDGTAALMVGDETGGSFEEVQRFKSMEELFMVAGGMQTLEPERAIWVHAWNKRVVARMAAETDSAIGICEGRDTGWQAFHRWSGWIFASRMTQEAAEALVVRVSPLNWDFEEQPEAPLETIAGLKDAIAEMAR